MNQPLRTIKLTWPKVTLLIVFHGTYSRTNYILILGVFTAPDNSNVLIPAGQAVEPCNPLADKLWLANGAQISSWRVFFLIVGASWRMHFESCITSKTGGLPKLQLCVGYANHSKTEETFSSRHKTGLCGRKHPRFDCACR